MNSKCLWLTFRKIIARQSQLEGKRVSIAIQTASSTIELQCSRVIKRGIANLYGESISLPLSVDQFAILIFEENEQKEGILLSEFNVTFREISSITESKKIFKAENESLEIFWEGSILDEEAQDILQQSQDVNRDFSEVQMPNAQRKRNPKTNIVYQQKKSQQITKKRSSFRLRKEKIISQFPQDRIKYTNSSTQDSFFGKINQKRTFDSLHKILQKSSQGDRSCSEIKPRRKYDTHPIFAAQQQLEMACEDSETGDARRQRKRNHLLHKKLNYQALICTSIVGIISGLTAVQF